MNLAEGPAFLATIYADLVASVARSAGVDGRTLLGRAVAHEIGHLLLGTNQHAAAGLMRATWSQADLRRKDGPGWQFQDGETQAMRRALSARLSTND